MNPSAYSIVTDNPMCDPVSAGLAISALTTVVSVQSQAQSAKAQQNAINEGWLRDMEAANVQQQQINASSAERSFERVREARQEMASARVGAAESGIGGLLAGRLEAEPVTYAAQDLSTIETNRRAGIDQSLLDRDARSAKYRSAYAGVEKPNYLGAGLQIAGATATARQKYKG
jgi:hypothetical protein